MAKMHKNKFSRAGSFYITVITFSFIAFSIIMLFFNGLTYNANRNIYMKSLFSQARRYTYICSQNIESISNSVVNFRYDRKLVRLVSGNFTNSITKEEKVALEDELSSFTLEFIGQSNYFKGLYIEDINGKEYLRNNKIKSCKSIIKSYIDTDTLNFTNKFDITFLRANNMPNLVITSPIYSETQELVGYVHVLVSSEFFQFITSASNFEKYEHIYVVDLKNNSAFTYTSNNNDEKFNQIYKNRINLEKIIKYSDGDNNFLELSSPDKQLKTLSSFYKNDTYGFGILCTVDKKYVVETATKYSTIQSITTLILIFLLGFIFFIVYKRNDKPLIEMIRVCNLLSEGDKDIRFPVQSDKELNILAETFNKTVDSMYSYKNTLETAAFIDPLLNVKNRLKYTTDVNEAIRDNSSYPLVVYVLDIEQFSNINEIFTNEVGDLILQNVAKQLKIIFDNNVYRINGDVFAMISYNERSSSEYIINKISDSMNNHITIEDKPFPVSYNLGICTYPNFAFDASILLERAQLALSHAKNHKTKNIFQFNEELLSQLKHNEYIISKIKSSIEDESVEVWYQPIHNIKTGQFTCAEALFRMKGDNGLYLNTEEVINAAEKNGYINDLGDIILKKACEMASYLYTRGSSITKINTNLSVLQILHPSFLERTTKILNSFSIPISYIGMEITEGILIESFDIVIPVLNKLRDMGVTLSLDDFGSGYSSINYLSKLPLNTLKLDRELVIQITDDKEQFNLIKSVVAMAKVKNLLVVAEGIEDKVTSKLIEDTGCDLIQGYLYSKPLSSDNFAKLSKYTH